MTDPSDTPGWLDAGDAIKIYRWPHPESAESKWIGLGEALAIHVRQLGLPEGFHRELMGALDYKAGLMWLSDQPIVLYERPLGLGFDRNDFDSITLKIEAAKKHGEQPRR
jgi:hypothetical protein